MSEPIPDLNLFMMCPALNRNALRPLPEGFALRACRPDELDLWKAIHFDDPAVAREQRAYMTAFFERVYAPKGDLFYRKCLFVCDGDRPVGTCFAWTAYGRVTTLHWFKVILPYEGRGIGRGLLSAVMEGVAPGDYPVFLHTQPSSYRAIKLYSDFGFRLLSDPVIGPRKNDLEECLPILRSYMPREAFEKLRFERAPEWFLQAVSSTAGAEF